jgi:hypothetical protein
MGDARIDRVAAIGELLAATDPPAVRQARAVFVAAQHDLALQRRLRMSDEVVAAYTYRAERALDRLRDCLRALPV